MANITEQYANAPVTSVLVELLPGETTLGLYEAKTIVERYISNDIPVELACGNYHQRVATGLYVLCEAGHRLSAISLLRAVACQVYIHSQKYA